MIKILDGFPEEVLPMLLVLLRRLQHCDVHRSMALDRGLRTRVPLLRRLLLDLLRAALHRLQAGGDQQGDGQLREGAEVLPVLLRALLRGLRGRMLQLLPDHQAVLW